MTGTEQRDQLLVGTETKKWRPDRSPSPGYSSRCWEGGSFHVQ
ncbi:MAG: hypothetical protein WAN22_32005 [Solirubrobacteraceae bacterium]